MRIKQRLLSLSILLIGLGLYTPIYKRVYQALTQTQENCDEIALELLQPAEIAERDDLLIAQIGIAIAPDGGEIYQLGENGIKITDAATGREQEFQLPDKFPELSWGTDITYDSKRNLIAIVSFGGEGYFYRFDVKKRRWVDVRSLNNIDLTSIAYDSDRDRYIAWGKEWTMSNLVFLSAQGELQAQESVLDSMPEFDSLYDRTIGEAATIKVAASANHLTLLVYPEDYVLPSKQNPVAVWNYSLDDKTIKLIYKSQQDR